jgi:hypothetical protein
MGLGLGIILMAVGAVLLWAVNVSSSAVNVDAIGAILLIVGFISFLVSLVFWTSFWGPGFFVRRPRDYDDRYL